MKDCMEPKRRPAGPACCLRDCKLSLRMQTDKQDRHHLPILPSTTETVAHASPYCSSSFSILHSISKLFFPPCLCTCMYTNCLIYFLYLSPPLLFFFLSLFLSPGFFSVDEMSQLALYSTLPSHCSMVRCLSIGGRECLGSFPCFTSLPV